MFEIDDAVVLLAKAKVLIEHGWCQGSFAKNSKGIGVSALDPSATCFCLTGAMLRIDRGQFSKTYGRAYRVLGYSLATWNDDPGRTQREVIARIEKGINDLSPMC